jgi:endonuclease/exonuclease/phosphatase family metal-dependent hydrolase
LRVATWNIHRGRGAFGPFRPQRIAAVLAEIRPDLVALQEAQHYLRRGTDMLDYAAIARDLGLAPLRAAEAPSHAGWRGNVVLARQGAVLRHGPLGLRLGGLEPRGALLAELDLGEGPFRLLACHLSLGAARRRAQAAALLAAMESGAGAAIPTLLLGDLNEWREHGSALAVLRPVFGPGARVASFPAFRPRLALDHVLAMPSAPAGVAVHDTPAARRASDHLPLLATWSPRGG